MKEKPTKYNALTVEHMILNIRGQKVILDSAIARLYGLETKRLNQQVSRNADRFPSDFMFQLTAQEVRGLRLQFATSNKECKPTLKYLDTEKRFLWISNLIRLFCIRT